METELTGDAPGAPCERLVSSRLLDINTSEENCRRPAALFQSRAMESRTRFSQQTAEIRLTPTEAVVRSG
jgi:hypothetical protein